MFFSVRVSEGRDKDVASIHCLCKWDVLVTMGEAEDADIKDDW